MPEFPSASIPASEARVLHSSVANADYLVSVAFPFNYDNRPDERWPVIFVLDANLYFGLVVDMVRAMNIRVPQCNELPDALIVGIGYSVAGSLTDRLHRVMHLRLRDFDATRDEGGEQFIQQYFPVAEPGVTGGAAEFLQFISKELIPLVETEYRADPGDRTLLGHSSGASFALYALFQTPELFQRYVAASFYPDLAWEDEYAKRSSSLPVRLHLVMEDMTQDQVLQHRSFVDRLRGRNYTGLRLTEQVLPNSTHCAMVPHAFQTGLLAVFS